MERASPTLWKAQSAVAANSLTQTVYTDNEACGRTNMASFVSGTERSKKGQLMQAVYTDNMACGATNIANFLKGAELIDNKCIGPLF